MLVATQAKTHSSTYNEQQLNTRLKTLLYSVAIISGAIQAWAGRYEMSPDGISYLDIADAYLRGDWAIAFNAQWSPLYCWLLAPVLMAVKHSPAWEFPAVHLLNFAIYLFSLACFDFAMRRLSRYRREFEDGRLDNSQAGLPEWAWTALGYALFMWSSFEMINLAYVQPDLLVASSVYLATGILLGMRMGQAGWRAFIALGAVLGFGYLAKAPMFLLAFVFLALSIFAVGNFRKALPRAAVALLIFLSIAAPFIFAISEVKGRPTFGDSGKLNYAWYVNDVTRFIHWQEGDTAHGTPAHTTRKIFDSPAVYEFAHPIESTYPPWYDPSYWYEGVKPRFDLAGQIKVLRWSADVWWHLLFNMQKGMIVLIFILLCMTGRSALRRRNLLLASYLFIPALAAFAMFSLVNIEARYIAPFLVLAWMGMLALVRLPDSYKSNGITKYAGIAMLALLMITAAPSIIKNTVSIFRASGNAHLEVASELNRMGFSPGDKVAMIGDSFRAYWARIARARIVAEIASRGPYDEITAGDENNFWGATDAVKSEVFEVLAQTGAVMVITDNIPPFISTTGWQRLGNTRYFARPLPQLELKP